MNLKPYNVKFILTNFENVFKNKDVTKLSKVSYEFVSLMLGFIAHYDINGFKNNYADLRDFVNELKLSIPVELDVCKRDVNDEPEYNGYGYEYCKSKYDIVVGIDNLLKKYTDEILTDNSRDIERLSLLEAVVKKCKENPEKSKELLDSIF